jgi:hypothetical protein
MVKGYETGEKNLPPSGGRKEERRISSPWGRKDRCSFKP